MITYRNAKREDLKEIANVHIECFSGYFLTSLGSVLLEKYYGEYMNESAPFIVATDEFNKIVGFCMGYQTGTKARANFESKYKWELVFRLIYLCIKFNKQAWARVLSKIKSVFKSFLLRKSENNHIDESENIGDILSICVIDRLKGTGVSKKFIEYFEAELKLRNINKYTLSVYATNHRARAFYEKMGFKIISEKKGEVIYIKTID